MYPAGIPEVRQNLMHYLLPVRISESYYCMCCSCRFVSQVSKTGAKLCVWIDYKSRGKLQSKACIIKKGQDKVGKKPVFVLSVQGKWQGGILYKCSLYIQPHRDRLSNECFKVPTFLSCCLNHLKGEGIFNLVVGFGVFFQITRKYFSNK